MTFLQQCLCNVFLTSPIRLCLQRKLSPFLMACYIGEYLPVFKDFLAYENTAVAGRTFLEWLLGFLYQYFTSILYPFYTCFYALFQYCKVQLFCKIKLLVKIICQFIVVWSIQMIAFVLKLFWKGFQSFSDVNAVMYQVLLGVKRQGPYQKKNEYQKINWLPVSNRVHQCLAVTACNFINTFFCSSSRICGLYLLLANFSKHQDTQDI